VVQWFSGSVVQWFSGSEDQRNRGSEEQRVRGTEGQGMTGNDSKNCIITLKFYIIYVLKYCKNVIKSPVIRNV
jgi:hypothetical protein